MDSQDFDELYYQYSNKVYSYIFLLVRSKEVSEEITQDTFYKVYINFNSLQNDASIYPWLIKIARNNVYDYFRKQKTKRLLKLKLFNSPDLNEVELPPDILIKEEKTRMLYEAIGKLPIKSQEILILRKIKGFSIKEVASILNVNEDKVKNTTKRAIESLKKEYLKGGDWDEFTRIG
ncbi:RNA polymerase sigma factor [Bacillaceae bacterium CLA-AA-H227]|uniref:RNA polymerase sigma factor n=1 Tax=Robertmurraya yapensis (ex Hitch et al 2024) TaxID=3133160 RepID=A0ACC6SBA0_9BACI